MTLKLAIFVPSNPARTRMNAEFFEFIRGTLISRPQTFVPVTLGTAAEPAAVRPTGDIRIEFKRADATIVVHWPLAGGAACAQWLRECLQ